MIYIDETFYIYMLTSAFCAIGLFCAGLAFWALRDNKKLNIPLIFILAALFIPAIYFLTALSIIGEHL